MCAFCILLKVGCFKRKLFFSLLLFSLLAACASSKVQKVAFEKPSQTKSMPLYIMPFMADEPTKLDEANDGFGGLAGYFQKKFDEKGTFVFNKKDITNLRQSVITSLTESTLYESVVDSTIETKTNKGEQLGIIFHSTGRKDTWKSINCWVKATVILLDSENMEIKRKSLELEGLSKSTLAKAKNRLIESFLYEIFNFLNS